MNEFRPLPAATPLGLGSAWPNATASHGKALSVVVPCFNEQDCIAELHERLTEVCNREIGDNYELVLVNDGSRDATWAAILALSQRDPHVVGVDLSRNHGHQLALTAGLAVCRGERIFVIDADLQDPPELLRPMWNALDQGADVAYGQRCKRAGESWFKRATAAGFYRLLRSLTDVDIPVDTGDFRLMSRRALQVLLAMPEQHRFVRGMVAWIGLKQVAIPYDRAERFAGSTKYPLKKMLYFATDAITSFSIRPLRLASKIGFWVAWAAFVMIAYSIYGWFQGETVAGWTSLAIIVLIMGSLQLFVLGMIGEYLGRLYLESKGRPLFVIREIAHRE